ncbi:MAG: lysine 5,6-aminomutase subunit alpha [Polyangiaceae bacterium]
MDRYLSAQKATRYVSAACGCKHLSEDQFVPGGRIARRAEFVLKEAEDLLAEVEAETIWSAIARGAFADVKRPRDGGKGYSGVVARDADYLNPLLAAMEAS